MTTTPPTSSLFARPIRGETRVRNAPTRTRRPRPVVDPDQSCRCGDPSENGTAYPCHPCSGFVRYLRD
jgi:hypothetical protein